MAQTLYFRLLLIALCSLCKCIQRQYYYININKTWTDAQKYCREHYTDLATVDNMNDMNELMKSVNNSGGVWIGLKNSSRPNYKWSLGGPVNYLNWVKNQSDQCNCVYMRNGEWQHQNCGERLTFICYNESSKRYVIETSNKTWMEAQRFCRQYHTDLTSVRNQTENQQIVEIINDTQTPVWIGLFCDPWEWSDNSDTTFRNWMFGEPNAGSSSPFCTEVTTQNAQNAQGQWNDLGCHNSRTFVCHKDKLILIKQKLNWMEALTYCRQNQVDLVSVDSEEIQHWVSDVVKNASTTEVWLGLRHSCIVGIWFWVNGEIVCDENWAEGNKTAVEGCETGIRSGAVQSGGDYRWVSLPETERRNFICMQRI